MLLTDSVTSIKGVGDKTAACFSRLHIDTVGDLLEHYPRDYEVYQPPVLIASLMEGTIASVEVCISGVVKVNQVKSLKRLYCQGKDSSGTIELIWFNQLYLKNRLRPGVRFIFRGKVIRRNHSLTMQQPQIFLQEEYRKLLFVLQPVYGLTEGITNHMISKAVDYALCNLAEEKDYLQAAVRKKYGLLQRKYALREIHFPKSRETLVEARNRLVFDEFFLFSFVLRFQKKYRRSENNHFLYHETGQSLKFVQNLSYELTDAQKKVMDELRLDLCGTVTMNRLIQGDVGSGKTILAVYALYLMLRQGYQGCFMVPTEVLARQHFITLTEELSQYGARILLLVGSMTAAEKKKAYAAIASHEADIIVGTHALIQEKVVYDQLALVITDEQHRFGVRQREKLSKKGDSPHVLVMSATPIPRTLSLILYGDLDISILNELPANRLPIKNCVVDTSYRSKAYQFIAKEIAKGRQAYVICPMVEESESIEAENVIDYTERLKEALPFWVSVQYLHGKMQVKEKEEIMQSFSNGDIHVLVSTTVVEVGINVPNATVMMIENSERFGLAQLHQLRGRVGRGTSQSYCILVSGMQGQEIKERLEILNQSNDGFYIAEQDMKLRGPGDMFGIRQSGECRFLLGDIYSDAAILKTAAETVNGLNEEETENLLQSEPYFREKISDLYHTL